MQLRNSLAIALPSLCSIAVQAQSWSWANPIGSPNSATHMHHVRPYAGDQILICGSYTATTLVLGEQNLGNQGQTDGYVALVDADGAYTWATTFGGSNNDDVVDVSSNEDGAFAVIGNFSSFFLSIGDTTLANGGEADAFIARFNADRTIAWVRQIGGTEIEEVVSVKMDPLGNTYVSGQVTNKFTLTTIHVFLRKYSPSGSLIWERTGEAQAGQPKYTSMAMDGEQNVYLSGGMYGHLDFGGTTLSSIDGYSAFIITYSPEGEFLDHLLTNTYYNVNELQWQSDHLYACAERQEWDIGWGWPLADSKVHVIKYASDLEPVWTRQFGGETPSQSLDIATALTIDPDENVYVTGSFFSDTLFFANDTLPNPYHINYYYPQIFVAKYNAEGDEVWGKSFGGIHSDRATSILAFGNDRFYLAGEFESDPLIFGTQELNNTSTLESFYVHLFPERYGRKPMGFLAAFDVGTPTGSIDRASTTSIRLWPNPAADLIMLQVDPVQRLGFTLRIHSLDGRLAHESSHAAGTSLIEKSLNDLPPGPYYITIQTGAASNTLKFVKH